MNLRPEQSRIHLVVLFFVSAVLAASSGCQNTDWNWDTTWWQKPQRTVRPTRQAKVPPASEREGEGRRTERSDPAPAPATPSTAPRPSAAQLREASAESALPTVPPASGQAPSPETAPASPAPVTDATPTELKPRPYYQLYFLRDSSDAADRGQRALKLAKAGARGCASVVEMLYVPMGKSGSNEECYLLYEEVAEFQAAAAVGPTFDIAPLKEAPATVGAAQAFEAGVGMLLGILNEGINVEASSVSACERLLAEALQSKQLPASQRWAAGILAGRLVSEFRFDFPTASSYYGQALQHVEPNSIEEMVGRWWQADALVQQGRNDKATAAYRAILRSYEDLWPQSHVVKRARVWLKSPPA